PLQRIQKDLLVRSLSLARPIHPAATLRKSYAHPIGRSITGPAIALSIHQSVQHHRVDSITLPPIQPQLPRRSRQDMARQMRNPHPGENQEAAVVHHAAKVLRTDGFTPSQIPVAWRHLPSGAGEQHTGQQAPRWDWGPDIVAQLRTIRYAIAQIVITVDVLLKQLPLAGYLN